MSSIIDGRALNELCRAGKLAELHAECERLLGEARRRFGETHEETGHATAWLARAHSELENFEKEVDLRLKCVELARRLHGPSSKEVVWALDMACRPLVNLNRVNDAQLLLADEMQLFSELPLADQYECVHPALLKGSICVRRKQWDEAQRNFILSLHHQRRCFEHSSCWTDNALAGIFAWLSRVYEGRGQLRAAERAVRKSLNLLRSSSESSPIREVRALYRLAAIQAAQSNQAEAVAGLHEAKRIVAGLLPGYQRTSDMIEKQLQAVQLPAT